MPEKAFSAPGPACMRKDADAFAVGHPGEAVGDADADPLLAADDGPDARGRRRFDKGVSRIAAEELHALAFQNLGDRVDDFHGLLLVTCLAFAA